jgi:hypothetical protein
LRIAARRRGPTNHRRSARESYQHRSPKSHWAEVCARNVQGKRGFAAWLRQVASPSMGCAHANRGGPDRVALERSQGVEGETRHNSGSRPKHGLPHGM